MELEEQVGSLTKEKETLEREVNMCKKQLKEYEGMHSLSKSKIRRSINPSFLRTSTI
jgi:chaperonin cofactor prefoldin